MRPMKTRIVRIGNSRGIRIPKPLIEQTGLDGDVEVAVHGNTLVISSARSRNRIGLLVRSQRTQSWLFSTPMWRLYSAIQSESTPSCVRRSRPSRDLARDGRASAPAHLRRAQTPVISTPHSTPAVMFSGLLGGAASGYITGMTKATEAVLADALRLDADSRAQLAAEILASLDGPGDADAEQAWRAEIAQRVADLEAGKLKLESWAEVKRRIEKTILGR